MIIQILKCNSQAYWYHDLVGTRFTASKERDSDYFEVLHDGGIFFVDEDDAIVLY